MGLEFARALAAKGNNLLLVSNREEELNAAKEELCAAFPVSVTTRFQDLARPDAADQLYTWCTQELQILPDIVINNAGMFFFEELSAQNLERAQAMVNLHVVTITRTCILFGNAMTQRGSGRLLIMSSMAARLPEPGITIYSATKAYLKSFGRSLSFELKPYGVSVTTVCPAAIATPLYRLDPKLMNLGVSIRLIHTPQWLVRKALKAMFRGRRVICPSFMNVWLPCLLAIIPGPVIAALWKRFKR